MKKSIIIETLQGTLEATMQEWLNTKKELAEVRIELEDTQEALSRSRNLVKTYKECAIRSDKLRDRLIPSNWFVANLEEGMEVLPGGIDEDMIEYRIVDKDQKKYAILLK